MGDGSPMGYRDRTKVVLAEPTMLRLMGLDQDTLRYHGVTELALLGCANDEIESYSAHITKIDDLYGHRCSAAKNCVKQAVAKRR